MFHALFPTVFDVHALLSAWVLGVYAVFVHERVVRRVRASERDVGLGWWVGGTLCLGSALWAQSLMQVLGMHMPPARFMTPLLAASWVPAMAVCGLTLWFNSHLRVPALLRVLASVIITGVLQAVPFMLMAASMFKPGIDWHWPHVVGAALIFWGSTVLGAHWSRWITARQLGARDKALMALVIGTLWWAGQVALLSGASVPTGAESMGDHAVPADMVIPLLLGVMALMMVLMHVGTVHEARLRQREQQLSESLARVRIDLVEVASRDPLTHLFNRQGFDQALSALAAEGGHRLAVMLINLDGFRVMVDHYGHAAGDALLRQVGARLRGLTRTDDVVARAEGDEFLLLVSQPGDGPAMSQLAQRVGDLLRQPYLINESELELTCSIGVALYPQEPNPARLVDQAHEAWLAARSAGGAAHCVYAPGMGREVAAQVTLQRDLRHAVQRGEMMLHYQPKLCSHTGEIAGVEALLRWKHSERGMVSPGEFIPVAERFGLIGELGTWVLGEACRQVRVWLDAGLEIPVAVNVSVHQLRQTDLEARVRDALLRHRVPPHLLMLEITESVAMENIDASLKVLDMLAAIGVHLSIDDFGTGYSSLSYLRRLPARQLKVDRSFVRDLDDGTEGSVAIVEAVVRLAHALKLQVVAEGVETESQARCLRGLGCDQLQGFLFAKPMAELDLLNWITQGPQLLAREVPHGAGSVDWLQGELPLTVPPTGPRTADVARPQAAGSLDGLSVV
jgi:diguanylate cyclase (GGDEF)-like protein